MTGRTAGRGSMPPVRLVVVTALTVAMLAAGCSKSGGSTPAAAPTTTNPAPATAAFDRGVRLVLEPSGHPTAITIPAAYISCIASHLSAPARARVAAVTNGDKVPGDSETYVAHAADVCGHGLLLVSIVRGLQMSGTPLSAAQARCASTKALAGLLRLDPATVGRNPDANAAERALVSSLDGCASFLAFFDATLRQQAPSLSPAFMACFNSKLRVRTFAQMAAAGEAGLDAAAKAATTACAPH